MNAGVYKAATGLLHQAGRLDAITDNLSNSSVPGYRRTVMSTRPFIGAMQDAMGKDLFEDGTQIDQVTVDFSNGPLRQTDRPLDFAIEGDAFFVVKTDDQTYYTRNGAFTVNADGKLVTSEGMTVGGDIVIPANVSLDHLTVASDGTLSDGKTALGTLELAYFPDPSRLTRQGTTLFGAPEDVSPETPPADTRVVQRMLESSNSSVISEMAEMIACMRNYETCQKMIGIQDRMETTMINKIV